MLSRLVRRTHMYLALALAPWVLMYAVSTIEMNHRPFFVGRNVPPPPFQEERRLVYDGSFPAGAAPADIARQLLDSLDLAGAHGVSRRDTGAIVISRNDLLSPRRITYQPADGSVLVERQMPRTDAVLERFHRRRGYATGYALDTAWAVTVDVFIAGMILWACSGLWMWWEMRATRGYGVLALMAGVLLFAVFLSTI